jgi:hypothetical protein
MRAGVERVGWQQVLGGQEVLAGAHLDDAVTASGWMKRLMD